MKQYYIKLGSMKSGFALPSVMIASLVLISVLIVSVSGMSALRVSLKNQYYGQLAQVAAEAGVEYAKSCLKASNGVATWSGKTLKVNTDCRGNEITECPASSSSSACFVSINGNIKTNFQVNAPVIDQSGKAGSITASGYALLTRGASGQPWRTVTRTAPQLEYNVPLPIISASGSGLNYRADDNYYYYVFTTPGTPTFTVTGGTLVADVLVVGGGGSGGVGAIGSNAGGGGGGGAVNYASNQTLTAGTYNVTVGSGGASQTLASTAGNSGTSSSFIGGSISLSAAGGGGGGATSNTSTALAAGKNGSSGGGGGSSTLAADSSGPAGGTASAGFAGGTGWSSNITANRSGGGGGGAGAIGSAAAGGIGGSGGAGTTAYTSWGSATTGLIGALVSSTYYLGAGGGGGTLGSTAGASTGGTAGTAGNSVATASSTAANNSGGGSGGTNGGASGAGGSGVVALRFARNAINNKIIPTGLSSTNLVLFLDAGNPASYSGSGNTWYDLSGNSNNATLFNSPTYSSLNGGVLTFASASTQYASVNHATNLAITGATDMTIIAFVKPNILNTNQIIAKSTNDIPQPYDFYINTSGNGVFRTGNGTTLDTNTNSSATLTAGYWSALAGRFIASTNSMQQNTLRYTTSPSVGYFFQTNSTSTATQTRSDGAQALLIGKNNSGSIKLDADIGMIAIYNTSLSMAQITEVINTFRFRYNI